MKPPEVVGILWFIVASSGVQFVRGLRKEGRGDSVQEDSSGRCEGTSRNLSVFVSSRRDGEKRKGRGSNEGRGAWRIAAGRVSSFEGRDVLADESGGCGEARRMRCSW